MVRSIAAMFILVFALSASTFAQDNKKSDAACAVGKEVVKHLEKVSDYVPPPVKPAVKKVVAEAKKSVEGACKAN